MYLFLTYVDNALGRDILDGSRFRGAIETIQKYITTVDYGFQMFVTFIGYAIVCVAVSKQILCGLYFAFPSAFDAINEAHRQNLKMDMSNMRSNPKGVILAKLPDIKSIVDFEDKVVSPKQFWLTSFPAFLVTILIGSFIYNGYISGTAAKVTDITSAMYDRFILGSDPVGWFENILGLTTEPTFASGGSEEENNEALYKVSKGVYNTVKTKWNDITSSASKATLANSVESWVGSSMSSAHDGHDRSAYDYLTTEPEKWKTSIDVKLVRGKPDIAKYNSKSKDGKTMMFADTTNVVDQFGVSQLSTKIPEETDWYILYVVKLSVQTQEVKANVCNDLELKCKAEIGADKKMVIYMKEGLGWRNYKGLEITINNNTYSATLKENRIIVDSKYTGKAIGIEMTISGLKLYDNASTAHMVTKITTISTDKPTWSSESFGIKDEPQGSEITKKE